MHALRSKKRTSCGSCTVQRASRPASSHEGPTEQPLCACTQCDNSVGFEQLLTDLSALNQLTKPLSCLSSSASSGGASSIAAMDHQIASDRQERKAFALQNLNCVPPRSTTHFRQHL